MSSAEREGVFETPAKGWSKSATIIHRRRPGHNLYLSSPGSDLSLLVKTQNWETSKFKNQHSGKMQESTLDIQVHGINQGASGGWGLRFLFAQLLRGISRPQITQLFWHPSRMHSHRDAVPVVVREKKERPPATFYQPFGLRTKSHAVLNLQPGFNCSNLRSSAQSAVVSLCVEF